MLLFLLVWQFAESDEIWGYDAGGGVWGMKTCSRVRADKYYGSDT